MTLRERIKSEMMVIKSLGVVYGDIGTSPIYTFAVILLLVQPTSETIFQILSMVFWTMFMLVTVQYAWLATSLSKRGEGEPLFLYNSYYPISKGHVLLLW
jgi:KUP system potassium uptake protein